MANSVSKHTVIKRGVKMSDNKNKLNKSVFEHRHVIRHDFIGETLSAQDFAEFQKIVNQRRPYSLYDFIPQHFIPNFSMLPDFSRQYGN